MVMRSLYLILPVILLMACQRVTRTSHFYQGKGFVLSDTIYSGAAGYAAYDGWAAYPVYYKGKMQDTVGIASMFRYRRDKREAFPETTRRWASADLELFVDTSVKIQIGMVCYKDDEWTEVDSVVNIHAYLLTVRNHSDSIISLGDVHYLRYVHREVKNHRGEWIRIEQRMAAGCIPHSDIYLNPGDIAIAKVRRFKGTAEAPCRIVLSFFENRVYSNVFMDSVDAGFLE